MARMITRRKRVLFTLLTCMWVFAAAVGVVEIAIRLLAPSPAFAASLNLHTNLHSVMEPDLSGVATPVTYTTNRWGMRGSEPPTGESWGSTTTIITVGGSTTQCFFLDDSRTWPAALEDELARLRHDVWVGNAGQAGHSTRAHVKLMEEGIARLEPDIVLFLVGVNDLSLSLRLAWQWDDTMSEALLGPARSQVLNWLLDHSRTAFGLYMLKEVHLDGTLVRTNDFTVELPSEAATGEEFKLSGDVDAVLESLPLFRRNVARLIRTVRGYGGTPVFLTQPLLIDRSSEWERVRARSFWLNKEKFHLTGAAYARLLDRFNEVLVAVCAEYDAPCFDLAGEIPHSTDYYYDVVHYNDAGARLVGAKVAAFLHEYILPHSAS